MLLQVHPVYHLSIQVPLVIEKPLLSSMLFLCRRGGGETTIFIWAYCLRDLCGYMPDASGFSESGWEMSCEPDN